MGVFAYQIFLPLKVIGGEGISVGKDVATVGVLYINGRSRSGRHDACQPLNIGCFGKKGLLELAHFARCHDRNIPKQSTGIQDGVSVGASVCFISNPN